MTSGAKVRACMPGWTNRPAAVSPSVMRTPSRRPSLIQRAAAVQAWSSRIWGSGETSMADSSSASRDAGTASGKGKPPAASDGQSKRSAGSVRIASGCHRS